MSSPLRYALDARVRQLRRGASSSFGVSAVWRLIHTCYRCGCSESVPVGIRPGTPLQFGGRYSA